MQMSCFSFASVRRHREPGSDTQEQVAPCSFCAQKFQPWNLTPLWRVVCGRRDCSCVVSMITQPWHRRFWKQAMHFLTLHDAVLLIRGIPTIINPPRNQLSSCVPDLTMSRASVGVMWRTMWPQQTLVSSSGSSGTAWHTTALSQRGARMLTGRGP